MLKARPESIAVLSFIVLFIVFQTLAPAIWLGNVPTMLRDVSWLGIVAIGQALVIISGEYDLSVGSVFALVGLVFVLLLNLSIGAGPALALSIGLAAAIGLVNGALMWKFQLPPLLVTLGFLFVYRGLVDFATNGFAVGISSEPRSEPLVELLGGQHFGVYNSTLICALILVIISLVLARTRYGNHLYAVGGEVRAAGACGIRVGRTKIVAFVISAMLAGFAGILAACSLASVSPTTGVGLEFEAVAAAVIGGCSLRGGVGTAWGGIFGVGTLMALKAELILLGVNIFSYQILLGLVLVSLIAVKGVFPKFFAPI